MSTTEAERATARDDAPEIRIRRGGLEDLPLIVRYNCLMAAETEGITLSVDTVTAGVRSMLDEPTRGFYLLAEALAPSPQESLEEMLSDDGTISDRPPSKPPSPGPRPVGQVMVTYEWSDWRCGDFWWIQSVYVQPEWRRRGVFRALFEHVKKESQKRVDVTGLRLYTATSNDRAQKAYRQLGMDGDRYVVFEWEKNDSRR